MCGLYIHLSLIIVIPIVTIKSLHILDLHANWKAFVLYQLWPFQLNIHSPKGRLEYHSIEKLTNTGVLIERINSRSNTWVGN